MRDIEKVLTQPEGLARKWAAESPAKERHKTPPPRPGHLMSARA
jgi:hypothetical protein